MGLGDGFMGRTVAQEPLLVSVIWIAYIDSGREGNALFNMSFVLDELGEREKAIAHAEAALKIFEQIESPYAEKVRQKLAEWRSKR